jgi:subtilisin family serine protease
MQIPTIADDRRRLIVAVTNDVLGNAFLNSLRENQAQFGFEFAGTLEEMLARRKVNNAAMARELRDNFAFLEVPPGFEFPIMNTVLRHGCSIALQEMADVDIEPDLPMRLSHTAGLGPNYQLHSVGSMHTQYLSVLNTAAAAPFNGQGISVAVVDSGFERQGVLSGFLDLVEPTNSVEKDNFGHGTAMASIIADVVPGASVYSIRIADRGPDVSEAMLGISAASFHFQADIINVSFGLPQGKSCLTCGSSSKVSRVFFRLLRSLSEKAMNPAGPPVIVAATGNDGHSTGFDSPAQWDFTVAVGSINLNKGRSTFSNYGTVGHQHYLMMPGGEDIGSGATEWVGEATQKCYGTSVAAAYASSVLGLLMSDPKHQKPTRKDFLDAILNTCQPCNNQNANEHGLGYLPYS